MGEAAPFPLESGPLLAAARERTGLRDFGGMEFMPGFERLLAMYRGAGLNERGQKATWRRLRSLLENRLRVAAALQRHPDVASRSIHRPMYIVSLPRTGTSALFNLLAADDAHRPLLFWEGRHPDPLEGIGDGPDPRMVALKEAMAIGRAKNPEFSKIHFVDADTPEECVDLLAHSMEGIQYGWEALVSPYREWFESRNMADIYAYYAQLLRLIDWQRPGHRWLLKSPAHLWGLDELLAQFGDACIVQTHRDPAAVVASYCSMMEALMATRDEVDPIELGDAVLESLATAAERAMTSRAEADDGRFVDVHYVDFVRDPLACVERVYRAFDLPLSERTRGRMKQHVESNPGNRHGRHRYSLSRWGLDSERVYGRFDAYISQYGVCPAGDEVER